MKRKPLCVLALAISSALPGCNGDSSVTSTDVTPPTVTTPEAQFSALRTSWSSNYLGDADLPFDSQLIQASQTVGRDAQLWLNQYQASRQSIEAGLWSDLPLATATDADKRQLGDQLYKSYQRLFTMARAYQLPHSDLHQDPQLLATLIDGLETLNQHYYKVGVEEWGNWWHWQLGISRVVSNTLVITYDQLPASLITRYIDALAYFVPSPTHLSEGAGAGSSSSPNPFESTGANRVHNIQVVLSRALLANDQASFIAAVDALEPVVAYVENGDGFYRDGSFIQHTDIAYNGSYGNELLESLGLLLGTISASPWGAESEQYRQIYPLLVKAYAPFLVNGRMMDMVNGRAVSRLSGQNHKVGHAVLNSLLFFVDSAPESIQAELKSLIKANITTDSYLEFFSNPRFFRNQQLAKVLIDDPQIPLPADRHQHLQFAAMDRVVHHRNNWSFSIAMHSARVGNYECINGENLKGWYSGDGMTYLYNQQLDHYSNYWPLVDAYHLPGTTSLDTPRSDCSGQLRGDGQRQDLIQWSGGVSLDQYGSSGFDFTNWDNTLSAKKSWFMFDEQIVALGSDVTNPAAVTNLENRKLDSAAVIKANSVLVDEANPFTGSLQRLEITLSDQANPISYLLLTPQSASVNKICRSSNYSSIGTNNAAVSGCFAQSALRHDSKDNYQYMLFPDSPSSVVDSEVTTPSVRVLSNNQIAHAVEHQQLNLSSYHFWQAGRVSPVEAFTPLAMLYRLNADQSLTVSLSDPMHTALPIRFKLDGLYSIDADSEQRVTHNADGSFSVSLADLQGRSYQFALNKD